MYTLASYDESGLKYAKDCVPAMLDLIRSLVIIGSYFFINLIKLKFADS